jgi:DNA-binding CsgD family transcriptional regulator
MSNLNRQILPFQSPNQKSSMRNLSEVPSFGLVTLTHAMRALVVITIDRQIVFETEVVPKISNYTVALKLFSRNDHLCTNDKVLNSNLIYALASMHEGEIRILRSDEISFSLTMRKVTVSEAPYFFIRRCETTSFSSAEMTSFSSAFGLTKAETRVLTAICDGDSLESIGVKLENAITTIRTHVRSILSKTNCEDIRRLVIRVHGALR